MTSKYKYFVRFFEDKRASWFAFEIFWPLENTFANFVKVGFAVLMGHSVFSEGQGSLVTLGKKNESSEARKSRAKYSGKKVATKFLGFPNKQP